jgi:hypothetical protein
MPSPWPRPGLRGVETRAGEVEHARPLAGDRHRRDREVALVGVERVAGLDGVEVGVLELEAEVELRGHLADQVDVEANRLPLLHGLEGLVGHVAADGQRPLLDDLGSADGAHALLGIGRTTGGKGQRQYGAHGARGPAGECLARQVSSHSR